LRAAATRLEAGTEAVQAGLRYEGHVWRQVVQRLDRRGSRRPGDPAYAGSDAGSDEAPDTATPDQELEELADIVTIRQIMAARLASFSETYRDEVWENLQDRLDAQDAGKQGLSGFFRRSRGKIEDPAGQDQPPADDLAERLRESTWRRVRDRIIEREQERQDTRNLFARRWVIAATAAALILAGLAPIAATAFR
jgi:hypothetical protein